MGDERSGVRESTDISAKQMGIVIRLIRSISGTTLG